MKQNTNDAKAIKKAASTHVRAEGEHLTTAWTKQHDEESGEIST